MLTQTLCCHNTRFIALGMNDHQLLLFVLCAAWYLHHPIPVSFHLLWYFHVNQIFWLTLESVTTISPGLRTWGCRFDSRPGEIFQYIYPFIFTPKPYCLFIQPSPHLLTKLFSLHSSNHPILLIPFSLYLSTVWTLHFPFSLLNSCAGILLFWAMMLSVYLCGTLYTPSRCNSKDNCKVNQLLLLAKNLIVGFFFIGSSIYF